MIGCTRCGNWHKHAEVVEGKKLSCTEVKQYWAQVRTMHYEQYGHFPRINRDANGRWICLRCEEAL